MSFSEDTVRGKIEVIDRNLRFIEESKEEFFHEKDNYKTSQAIKYSLVEIMESAIDIASRILASEGWERPEEYRNVFKKLSEKDIIPEKLGKKLSDMAGFRNILIHKYDRLDEEKFGEILKNSLVDVEEFISAVYKYMDD